MDFEQATRFVDGIDHTPPSGEVLSIFRAVNSRAAWRLADIAEGTGKGIIKEYGLRPGGQNKSGIGLDWKAFSEKEGIWVPADYIEPTILSGDNILSRALFDNDEINAFTPRMNPKHRPYVDAVLDVVGGDAKIELLTTDSHWRDWARGYAQRLIECIATRGVGYASEQFKPVLEALTYRYRAEMR